MGKASNQGLFSFTEELPEKGAEEYCRPLDSQGPAPSDQAKEEPGPRHHSNSAETVSTEDIEANKLRATNLYFAKPMYDLIAKSGKEPFDALDHHTVFMHAFEFVHRHLGLGTHEQGGVTRDQLVDHLVSLMEHQFSAF